MLEIGTCQAVYSKDTASVFQIHKTPSDKMRKKRPHFTHLRHLKGWLHLLLNARATASPNGSGASFDAATGL